MENTSNCGAMRTISHNTACHRNVDYEYDNDVDPQLNDKGGDNSQVVAADDTFTTRCKSNPRDYWRVCSQASAVMSPSGKQYVEIEKECNVKNKDIKRNDESTDGTSFDRKLVIKQSLLIFSAISNTKLLFKKNPKHLNTISTILLMFISLELLGRSYVQPVFYNNIGLRRQNTGITKEFSTAKKFFWLRNSSYSMSIFILMSAIVLAYS
ncbi:unnamed protein product [Medioppia subpectinata]|uniref:Uncharacterized protein n=1 Tax=Medioppia subpectinata TaxID=1979941 RepID=A0A7R9L7D9_9ACAR|nr:unnamed protein product [Medioppia subpectinata]CAG2116693.1 unnamed protein product [Medioppia subpectinata]